MRNFNKLTCGENSKKHYLFYLTKILGKKPENIMEFEDSKLILEKLKEYSPNSKNVILCAILGVLKTYKSYKFVKLYRTYSKIREDVLKEIEQYKEGKKYVPINDENQVEQKPLLSDINNPLRRFIYALYTEQTPRRAMDYYACEIIDSKENIPKEPILNYLVEKEKVFVFSKYKTASRYKTQEIPISDKLWEEYMLYKPFRFPTNNRLLQKENGEPVDNNQFISYHLNKVLGEGKAVNYLRHSFVRSNLEEHHKAIEQSATEMGHSFMANNYYKNFN